MRRNPVPIKEQEIGQRLRTFRVDETHLSLAAFAREIGIDSSALGSYEHGRNPLRYATASRACSRFGINQRWLAQGINPNSPAWIIHEDLAAKIDERMLFSHAYELFIKPNISKEALKRLEFIAEFSVPRHLPVPIGCSSNHESLVFTANHEIAEALRRLPENEAESLLKELLAVCAKYRKKA